MLLVWFTSRFIIWVAGTAGHILLPFDPKTEPWNAVESVQSLNWMAHWDSGWYSSIVTHGYYYDEGRPSSVAFFPLYPLVVKMLTMVTQHVALTGIVLSHVLFGVALWLFVSLLKQKKIEDDKIIAATWLLALFPGGIFYSFHYSESLFLTLVLAVFYFCEKYQLRYAVPFALLASATRVPGVIMWGIVGLYWFRECGWRPGQRDTLADYQSIIYKMAQNYGTILLIMLCPLGLVAYMGYLYLEFGDPWLFFKAQQSWGKEQLGVLYVFIKNLTAIFEAMLLKEDDINAQMLRRFYELLFTLIAMAAAIRIWKRIGPEYALFIIISLLMAMNSAITSNIRYVAVLFPVFIYLGLVIPSYLRLPVYLCSMALAAVFASVYANGSFIG